MEAEPIQRLRIKIGEAEFEAEGPSDVIREQYEQFLTALRSAPPAAASNSSPSNGSGLGLPASPALQTDAVPPNPSGLPDDVLSRVFRKDGEYISLLALPRGDRQDQDALIALLYGFSRLTSEQNVTGVRLMQSARQSGVNLSRIDRALDSEGEYIMQAGARRGRRYGLNNRGKRYAEDVIRALIE